MVGMFKEKKVVSPKKTPSGTKSQPKANLKTKFPRGNPRATFPKTSEGLTGFGLMALSLFIFISLLTYHPTSGSDYGTSYHSSSLFDIFPDTLNNLTGVMGTLVAGTIVVLFGTAGYLIPFIALQRGIRCLKGALPEEKKKSRWSTFLFLILLSALFFLLSGENPEVGGISGELVAVTLATYFNTFGALLVILAGLLISGMKVSHASLLPWFSWTGAVLKNRLKKNTKSVAISAGLKKPSGEGFLEGDPPHRGDLPPLSLLKAPNLGDSEKVRQDLSEKAALLEERLKGFGVEGKVTGIHHGPVITRYEFDPAPGVRVTRILHLADDLALGLKAGSLRVVVPVPGEAIVGIEIPNETRQMVYLREVVDSPEFRKQRSKLTLALGKDIRGRPFVTDLAWMPHLLIAGATGSGKSVCLNGLICSLLFKATSEEVKFIFIDPKRLELGIYAGLPHLLRPLVTEAEEALEALNWTLLEMENRYKLLAQGGVRNLAQYNARIDGNKGREGKPLPYIVVVVDELADLMLVSSRRVEKPIVRIAQMARAVGIHMIVATQRPSVNVVTGLIKANFPARIAFRTASQIDSRTILDCKGAESLMGNGDMLFLTPGAVRLERIHGAFVSEEEIYKIIRYLKARC